MILFEFVLIYTRIRVGALRGKKVFIIERIMLCSFSSGSKNHSKSNSFYILQSVRIFLGDIRPYFGNFVP